MKTQLQDNRFGPRDYTLCRPLQRAITSGLVAVLLAPVAWPASAGGAQRPAGTVVAWGGQTNVPANLTNVVAIAAGEGHSLALKSDGTVVAWGDNTFGQTDVPPGLSGVTAIAAGFMDSLALRQDGTVVAWGKVYDYNSQNWIPAPAPSGLSGVGALAGGYWHNLALQSNGTVVAWGSSWYTNVPPNLGQVIGIGAGGASSAAGAYSLALKSDGTVVAWGDSSLGATKVPLGLRSCEKITCK